ncbi:MAG: S8 family serine peptidase [Pseudonocardiaceae bacterium]|nr:S8 family serine peptidase [Pseudonocardiaceae bacterium]
MSRSSIALLAVVLATGLTGAVATAGAQQQDGGNLADGLDIAKVPNPAAVQDKLGPRMRAVEGTVTAFVELNRRAGADAFAEERRRGGGRDAATASANRAKSAVRSLADTVIGELRSGDAGTTVLARTVNAVSGVVVRADATRIRELAGRPDVRSVRTVVPKKRTNTSAAQLTKTLNAWQQTGQFGDDMRVGIIDDGIDYTHADFGGPGTKEAYEAIDPTKVEASYFPTAKVVGGTDLVGDDYDSAGEDGDPEPKPDPNPLGCGAHGTHVAGSAGGMGVNGDGSTFRGDYSKLDGEALNKMRVGPGMAPESLLYAIKVFGCGGSTEVTAQAMDWALDPDGDGDFSDRLDVINMSLGSDFGAPDDPDSLFVRKLAAHGVLSVISAGNSGNIYDVGGSPGNTPEALTVASTRDSYVLRDAVEVTAPGDVAGNQIGQYSQDYEGYDELNNTKPVVPLSDQDDGCEPYSEADKAAVAGKFVWLEWDDNDATRACGSTARADNAEQAGAEGVLLSSTLEHFTAGIAGNAAVPMFQLTGSATEAVRPALRDGTLETRFAGALRASEETSYPEITDTPSAFTSRGVRGPAVKPDVGAPGDTIASAARGSGNGVMSMSGTSMAAPHTSGIAALVRQAHPDWTPEEVKAAVMNTATADLHGRPNGEGPAEAPQRVGAGRVNAEAAVTNEVLAMVRDDPGSVGVSFGTVEAGKPVSLRKTIELVNKGSEEVSLSAAYQELTTVPGVSYELSEDEVSLSPRGTAKVDVTLRIDDPAALRKTADPTIEKTQLDVARQFLADASGRVVFTPEDGGTSPLRVPVYAAPKPTADIGTPNSVRIPDGEKQAVLNLEGRGIDQGAGDEAYRSLISVLQHGASSPRLPECNQAITTGCTINDTAKGADLRHVGAASTAPLAKKQGKPGEAMLAFGIATWENWANVGSNTIPFVDIDTTGDGQPDFETYAIKAPETDVLVANTVDLNAEGQPSVDVQPVNGTFGNVDTNVFDSNVLTLLVNLEALGIDAANAKSAPISYTVGTTGYYTPPGDKTGNIDQIDEPIDYDPLAPGMWVQGGGDPALSYLAKPGTSLVVNYDAKAAERQGASSLLALHLHNESGDRAGKVAVRGGKQVPPELPVEESGPSTTPSAPVPAGS